MSDSRGMSRRAALHRITAAAACAIMPSARVSGAGGGARITGMGLVIYDCIIRRRWMRQRKPGEDLFAPLTFLRHCRSLGAGGMQASLGTMTPGGIRALREFAEEHALYIDAIVKPPKSEGDLARFEAEIKTAREVGAQAARTTIIPGRRYERFSDLAEFRRFEERGRKMLARAAPIVEKHRVRFAVENHKDQRIDERVALFKQFDSEYIGACVDTGNSFALLDGAYEPIEALAPYTFSVHLKDQALREYRDGFLLGDVPLGGGSFDMKRMVDVIRGARPGVKFSLELITRDALKVPCLTDGFYSTMPSASAVELARTMRFVRAHEVKRLQEVSRLPVEEQVRLEDENVSASIRYAGAELGL